MPVIELQNHGEQEQENFTFEVVDGDECYEFTWVGGKKQSIIEGGNHPIRKTVRPGKEEIKDWNTTENLYIEGDNLDVLKLLQNPYLNKVKMIYIDPLTIPGTILSTVTILKSRKRITRRIWVCSMKRKTIASARKSSSSQP